MHLQPERTDPIAGTTPDLVPCARRTTRIRKSILAALVIFSSSLLLSGCGFFCRIPRDPLGCTSGDRCYIEDSQFITADHLYSRLGSIQLTERHLREVEQWRKCEINEALYRIRKVHNLP